jgi:hypothetical protein
VPLDALGPVLLVEVPFTGVHLNDITGEELETAARPGFFPGTFDAAPILGSGAGEAVYTLRSVVCARPHHFVAFCRRGNQWMLFDDGRVQRLAAGDGPGPMLDAMAAGELRPILLVYDSPADAAARRRAGPVNGGVCGAAPAAAVSGGEVSSRLGRAEGSGGVRSVQMSAEQAADKEQNRTE